MLLRNMIGLMRLIFLVVLVLVFYPSFAQQLEPKKENGKWGFVNKSKEWVVKPKYDEVKPFQEDVAAVRLKGKWGFIFESGKWAVKPKFSQANGFSEGKAGVVDIKDLNGLWGFINKQGEWVIAPSFQEVKSFKNNECLVKTPSLLPKQYIVINEVGKPSSPPFMVRKQIATNVYHLVSQKQNGAYLFSYVNRSGELLAPWSLEDYDYGVKNEIIKVTADVSNDQEPDEILTSSSGLYLYASLDENGKVISDYYEEIREFYRGFAVVRRAHNFGFIDADFKEVTPLEFREVRRLNDEYCVGQTSEESFVLLDFKGEKVSKEYHGFDIFDEDYLLGYELEDFNGERRYKQALFDFDGTQKSGWYTKIYPKSSTFYRILDGDYITKNGVTKFEVFYNYIVDSTGEVLSDWRKVHGIEVKMSSSKLKDSVYQFLHQPESDFYIESTFFENVFFLDLEWDGKYLMFNGGDFYDGMAMISSVQPKDSITKEIKGITYKIPNVKYGFMDWNGDVRLPCKLDYTSGMSNGKAVFRSGDKYGVINYKGKVSLKPSLSLVGNFGNGLAPSYKDTAWNYISYTGKEVLPALFDEAHPFVFGYAAVKKGNKWGLIDTRGNEVLAFKYRKPPVPIDRNKIRVLIDGVGYEIITL